MKLIEIATSWAKFLRASPAHQEMIKFRLSVCDGCPQKAQLSPLGKSILQAVNDKANVFYCKKCGCPLAGKTANPKNVCPLKKWAIFQPNPTVQ